MARDGRGLLVFVRGQSLTATERAQLESDKDAIALWLEPSTSGEVGTLLIAPLIAVRIAKAEGDLGAVVTAEYAEALDGLPTAALNAARRALNRDEVPDVDPKFMPTPTELARVVKRFVAKAECERRWIDHILALGEQAPEQPESPEMKARCEELISGLSEKLRRDVAQRALDEIDANEKHKAREANEALARSERVATALRQRTAVSA